jgi:hypothetical protein
MRSEIYITNLIQASPYACQLISSLLGLSSRPWETGGSDDLLFRLPLKESLTMLMDHLECDEDEVFQKIAAHLNTPVTDHYPLNFTIDHLRELDNIEANSHLSAIFNCDPWDTLDELLDVQAILDTLFEVAPEMVRHMLRSRIQYVSSFPSASEAIRNILLAHRKVEEHFDVDEYKWNRIIDEHKWLKSSAIAKLHRFCAERGIVQQSGASLLAATLQEYALSQSTDEVLLDSLAIIHIQQRINWIVRQLYDQVEELAQKVSMSVEASSPLAQLEQHLKFYELKAPASAWRLAFESTEVKVTTIREKLSKLEIRSTGSSGTPKSSSYLKVRTEKIDASPSLRRFWGKGEIIQNLIVSCQIQESNLPCDILICSNVPTDQFDLLEEFFSSIPTTIVASRWISDIGSQIMLAPLISSTSFRDALITACTSFSREIIQGLILAGVKFQSGLELGLDKCLRSELSIKPIKYDLDLVQPINRSDVVNMVRNDYVDNNVRIIK